MSLRLAKRDENAFLWRTHFCVPRRDSSRRRLAIEGQRLRGAS